MAIINFTVEFNLFAIEADGSDAGVDADQIALVGEVTFTPLFRDQRPIMATGYSPPAGFILRPITGWIDSDGALYSSRGGDEGVRLPCNDPVLGLAKLGYNVTFNVSTPLGESVRVQGGYFEAPSEDTTIQLADVLQTSGSAAAASFQQQFIAALNAFNLTLSGLTGGTADAARAAIGAVSDFDFRLDDTRTPTDASVTLPKLTPALKSAVENMSSPNFTTAARYVLNTESTDDETTKETYYGVPHYDNTEDPVSGVTVFSSDTYNMVRVGGGSLYGRAANQVEFYTAADQVTDFGTRAGYISSGRWSFLLDAEFGSNSTATDTDIRLNTAAGNNRTITFASAGVGRWIIVADDSTESGSDAGSDLIIRSRTDAGAAKTDVVTFSRADGSATFAGTVDTPHGSSAQFALPGQLLAPRAYTSGQYFFCNSQGTTSTGNTTNNTVRVSPWLVTEAITISRLFAEFTVAGEASSEFRFGIWNDDGAGKPGTLLLDAGTASTAGSPGAFEVTVSQAVGPGIYWVGGAVQNASSTQPTMRTVNTSAMPTALPLGSSLPSTTAAGTFIQGSVTGAFSDFTASPSLSTIAARIGFKVA